jgi:CubicO group peptidase (beta-lactamase class C family)
MKETFLISVFLLIFSICFGQQTDVNQKEVKQKIDNYINEVIEINEIPGVALAVIKDGKVIYEKYSGKASFEDNQPVDKNTAFKIFSTTKLITNVGVFQLIEKGKLSPEDPISKYLDNLPKEWQSIKVKNLLTHSSGLPDIVMFEDIPITLPYDEKIAILTTKPMEFVTGAQYSYNQTNYFFLAKIIEKITGLTFEEYILQNQFPEVKSGVYFSSDFGKAVPNSAFRYNFNTKTNQYVKNTLNSGADGHSANGLNITLPEFIRWNENLDKNTFLKSETKYSMWEPFQYTKSKEAFGYGWDFYPVNKVISYGFTGGNETAFRKFVKNDITIIFLSNGHKYDNLYVQSQVVNHVAGIVDKTLVDAYLLADEKITQDFLKLDFTKAELNYLVLKKNHPEWKFEDRLNVIGYTFMNYGRINDAIKVFELNTKENPKSGNAFDSLAESYFNNNQLEKSKQTYQKALALSPENANAKEMLVKIDKLLAK